MDARTLLREAAKILRRDGWCQKTNKNQMGQHCLVGAIEEAFGREQFFALNSKPHCYIEALDRVRAAMLPDETDVEAIGRRSVTYWNDMPGRTAEDVIAVLERAAEPEQWVPPWRNRGW